MHTSLAKPVLPYSDPDLVELGWNDRAVGAPFQDLYSGGYCATCRFPVGARNDHPVLLSRAPKGVLCGFEQRTSQLSFISDVVLAALSEREVGAIAPRPVAFAKPRAQRRQFFEVGGTPVLAQVGVRGGRYWSLADVHCRDCGYRAFACSHPELKDTARASSFVARADLPADVDSAFLVRDTLGRARIAMSHARFRELVASLPQVSFWPGRLFCLDDTEVEREPVPLPGAAANV
jgi:hypothetical protein